MKNILLIATTSLLWVIPSNTTQDYPSKDTKQAKVTIIQEEIEIEYLPSVDVQIVHDEVTITRIFED